MMRVLTSGPGFVCLLIIMMLFAYWQPAIGASEGNLNIKYISELLVIMIFLFQGSRLNIENLALLLQRPVSSLVLQAGIIFLPVLWVKLVGLWAWFRKLYMAPCFFQLFYPLPLQVVWFFRGTQAEMPIMPWVTRLYPICSEFYWYPFCGSDLLPTGALLNFFS